MQKHITSLILGETIDTIGVCHTLQSDF